MVERKLASVPPTTYTYPFPTMDEGLEGLSGKLLPFVCHAPVDPSAFNLANRTVFHHPPITYTYPFATTEAKFALTSDKLLALVRHVPVDPSELSFA